MRNTEKGTSYISILLGVMVVAFILKAIVAVWPSYWDDRVINKEIEKQIQKSASSITPSQFSTQMSQSFNMNNIRDIQFDDIASVNTENGLEVIKRYEVRKPFLLNIDLILTFEKSFDQRSVQSK